MGCTSLGVVTVIKDTVVCEEAEEKEKRGGLFGRKISEHSTDRPGH